MTRDLLKAVKVVNGADRAVVIRVFRILGGSATSDGTAVLLTQWASPGDFLWLAVPGEEFVSQNGDLAFAVSGARCDLKLYWNDDPLDFLSPDGAVAVFRDRRPAFALRDTDHNAEGLD